MRLGSPDYADSTKFADEWLAAAPGTDAAPAMAMGHVILKEFFVDATTPYFDTYVERYTDLPFLVRLEQRGDSYVPGKFLTAAYIAGHADQSSEHADFKTVLLDEATGDPVVPNGSLGFRYGEDGAGQCNLDLGKVCPRLSAAGPDAEPVRLALPRFDGVDGAASRTAGRRVRPSRAEGRAAAVRRRGPGRAGELSTGVDGVPTCSAAPARATNTSSSTCSAPTPPSVPPKRHRRSDRRTWSGTSRHRPAS